MTTENGPCGPFGAILADPPWTFTTWSDKAQRSAKNHYRVMDRQAIIDLPVGQLAAPACALFLWATFPNLPQALDTMQAWGFTYKTCAFVWAKTTKGTRQQQAGQMAMIPRWHMGLGYYTRANAEVCLLGTRGRIDRQAHDVRQLIVAPVTAHSEKPAGVHQKIERLMPGPYIELFARRIIPGWTCLGDGVDGEEIAVSLGRTVRQVRRSLGQIDMFGGEEVAHGTPLG